MNRTKLFTWNKAGGYEVSSAGDKRFSALFAKLSNGLTIEVVYQCRIKGYDPHGVNWRLGKGRPSLIPNVNLRKEYLQLWRTWAYENLPLMRELYVLGRNHDYVLSDRFATSENNQANALSIVLNELVQKGRNDALLSR